MDLRKYLNRPQEHLQKYPVLLDAVYRETPKENPDGDFLLEAIHSIKNLQLVAQTQKKKRTRERSPEILPARIGYSKRVKSTTEMETEDRERDMNDE